MGHVDHGRTDLDGCPSAAIASTTKRQVVVMVVQREESKRVTTAAKSKGMAGTEAGGITSDH
jgi:hypothetical protein